MENEARRLGFVFDERLQKWRHPSFRHYANGRAKNAVEDYRDLVKTELMRANNEELARAEA